MALFISGDNLGHQVFSSRLQACKKHFLSITRCRILQELDTKGMTLVDELYKRKLVAVAVML